MIFSVFFLFIMFSILLSYQKVHDIIIVITLLSCNLTK